MTIEDRWALRHVLRSQRRRLARAPRVTLDASVVLSVGAPASAVWHALTSPDAALRLAGNPALAACAVPGTPSGVGGMSALVCVTPDGTAQGALSQDLVVEPGHRLVSGILSGAAPTVQDVRLEPDGDDACTLHATLHGRVPAPDGAPVAEAARADVARTCWRLHRHLCGADAAGPEPAWPPAVARARDAAAATLASLTEGRRVVAEGRASAVLPVPPDVAMELVRRSPAPTVERGDPRAWWFPVPAGSVEGPYPSAAVRAFRATVARDPFAGSVVLLDEVVEEGPWHVVTRGPGAFDAVGSVHVVRVPAGARVDVVLRQEFGPRHRAGGRALLRWRAGAYVARLQRTLSGAPEPALARAFVP